MAVRHTLNDNRKKRRTFKDVKEFLQYVFDNSESMVKGISEDNSTRYKLVEGVVGQLMNYLLNNSKSFSHYVDFYEDERVSVFDALKTILKKVNSSHYILRFFIKQELFKNNIIKVAQANDKKDFRGQVRLRLDPSLPKPDRVAMHHTLKGLLHRSGDYTYLHPETIEKWFVPAIIKGVQHLQNEPLKGHNLTCHVVHNELGFGLMINSVPVGEDVNDFSILLELELAFFVSHDAAVTYLPNPLPHGSVDYRKGWDYLSQVKRNFQEGKLRTVAYSKLQKLSETLHQSLEDENFDIDDGVDQHFEHKTEIRPHALRYHGLRSLDRDVIAEHGVVPNTWNLDFTEMEQGLVSVIQSQLPLDELDHAIQVYTNISLSGRRALPEVDDEFWCAVKFWAIKKYFSKDNDLVAWFSAVVELIFNAYSICFCGCPTRNNINVCPLRSGDVSEREFETMTKLVELVKDDNAALLSFNTGIYRGYCLATDVDPFENMANGK